jgi:hypothetical protein
MRASRYLISGALFCLAALQASPSPRPLWGDLTPGAHSVGYRVISARDLSRPAIPDTRTGYRPAESLGRQLQISVWYPAAPSSRPMLQFGRYVDLLAQQTDFRPLDESRRKAAREFFEEQPRDLGGDVAVIRANLPALTQLSTGAVENAPPAPGRHPLVIFPDYRAPATNSVLAEYLASRGFVVASMPMMGSFASEYDAGLTGIETTARDIEYALGVTSELPFVDSSKIGVMGLGIAASAALVVQMRNPAVDALVSLDGGIPTAFEDGLLKRSPYYSVAAARVPILGIHAPHENVDPRLFDQYRYSRRVLIHFPAMSEFFFLNYAMLDTVVPGIIGKKPGDVRKGFEWAARYVAAFFDSSLRAQSAGDAYLAAPPEKHGGPAGLATVEVRPPLPPAPTLTELKAMYSAGGITKIATVIRELRKNDPAPVSAQTFSDLHGWLAWTRDPTWEARKEWSRLRVESFPMSARAHFALANAAAQTNDRELAKQHFARALALVETDPDPVLDPSMRERIRTQSAAALTP